eukprot:8063749-Alexandrium_andersonii.AAC.1
MEACLEPGELREEPESRRERVLEREDPVPLQGEPHGAEGPSRDLVAVQELAAVVRGQRVKRTAPQVFPVIPQGRRTVVAAPRARPRSARQSEVDRARGRAQQPVNAQGDLRAKYIALRTKAN